MTITLRIFLYIYIGLLSIYTIFSIFNFYHIFKFGLNKFGAYVATILYIAGILIVLGISFFLIAKIDWSNEISIFDFSANYINSPYGK